MSGSFRAPGGRFLISTGTATQALWASEGARRTVSRGFADIKHDLMVALN